LPGKYARDFRAAYRAGALVPEGNATLAGKRVKSFQSMESQVGSRTVYWRPGTPPPASVRSSRNSDALVAWYVDRSTAELAGFKVWGCAAGHSVSCERRSGPRTVRIVTFQRLAPTPQNLVLLTGPGAP
jgi:hypothetical protein